MNKNLVFFNKEGDYLNIQYNETTERYEGDLIFHENSSDTFKTIGLYMFENVPSFEFEVPGSLALDKFQLFNEHGFNFTGNSFFTQSVTKIETINNDNTFFSKWIYGQDFEKKYPIGSQIIFNQQFLEFTNLNQTYTVVATKKGAIMIISNVDNTTFNNNYGSIIGLSSSYTNISISGVNAFGVYNYVDQSLNNKISSWSEPDFYLKYFPGKKLNLLNTELNDRVATIKNNSLLDRVYYKSFTDGATLTQSSTLKAEVILKTDLPMVYSGALVLNDDKITFINFAPSVLKPGSQISILGSTFNQNFLTISQIAPFNNNLGETFYATQSHVIYNNQIWECLEAYTQSATSSITPDTSIYWSNNITYLNVDESLINETVGSGQVYLTTNRFYYDFGFTQSQRVTMASFAEKYQNEFSVFNINLYYSSKSKTLNADLIYPSKYAEVNFYQNSISATDSITTNQYKLENQVQVEEILKTELNRDFSERWNYNIVFTDIDSFGIKVTINGMLYQEEVQWVYTGLQVDMQRTIDKTLRSWLSKWYVRLFTLGIIAKLEYLGNAYSIYYNGINLTTQYPNVPIEFSVEVGTTADYYIEHSSVIFYDMGVYFDATINGRNYGINSISNGTQSFSVSQTLNTWVEEYSQTLSDFGITVTNVNNSLIFSIESQDQPLEYQFKIGKSSLPGEVPFEIKKKFSGNLGALVTSNSMVLPQNQNLTLSQTQSFLEAGFATGMVVTVNNTLYPWNNQQYNILYVDGNNINFSYQGPFWATDEPFCDSAPFTTIAFSLGFGATGCEPPPIPQTGGGEFATGSFEPSFSLQYQSENTYNQELYSGTLYMTDLLYLQISENMYVLGGNLLSVDASSGQINSTINFSGNTQSVCLRYNSFNNYLYALTNNLMYVVDPVIDTIVATMSLSNGKPYDCVINDSNGDIYVSYSNLPQVDIWSSTNGATLSVVALSDFGYSMVYNPTENSIYVEQNNQIVSQINGSTRSIDSTYNITGLTHSLIYDPSDSAVFAFGTYLNKINSGTVSVFNSVSLGGVFNYGIYDNLNNNLVLSISSTSSTTISAVDSEGNQIWSKSSSTYGHLTLNQFDGDIYQSSRTATKVFVIDSPTGQIKHSETFTDAISKTIFNPVRNSIWGLQPTANKIVEVGVNLSSQIVIEHNPSTASFDGQYGTLDPNYVPKDYLWIKTDPYIRQPRQNYTIDNSRVKYVYKWQTDQVPQMFMYDFSGKQLTSSGPLAYTGEKPLSIVALNRQPNKNPELTQFSEYQQTIFSEIVNELDYIDSQTNLTFLPTPLELFIGYNSEEEGTNTSVLQLFERENISLIYTPNNANYNIITFTLIEDEFNGNYGSITLDQNSTDNFLFDANGDKTGLRVGQLIKLYISDITNTRNKFLSFNHGKTFKIREIYTRNIIVDFTDQPIVSESTIVSDYPKVGNVTYLRVNIKTVDKEIGRFTISGQTEIEDERYRIELGNTGHLISSDNVYIFKEYDINEQGIDWTYLNKKRKEMLLVRSEIYPYVGSYKAIINAINYFGYNDLQLYEYYRNVNPTSPDYLKLFKVEIPDIFDNSVEGWTENDFIKNTLPNVNFADTNLFNLTYRITDTEGNNLLFYSLREVLIKLQGLKYWLQSNVIPITHKILDITGRADFVGSTSIIHKSYDTTILNFKQQMTPVDFKLNEVYLMPVNSGSTVYNCVIDFILATSSLVPDYFTMTIRTYKTYKEWNPFVTYNQGDRVIYYNQLYESDINNNRVNDPREYDSVFLWSSAIRYQSGEAANYKSKIYRYIGLTFSTDGLSPVNDPKWIDITTWRKIDFEPVQTIKEFRTATQSYNFTVDSNLDPFIAIEVTSENGYGQTYTSKKNYELRGLKDLTDDVMLIEADPLPRRLQAPAPPPPPPPVKLPPTDLLYTPTFTSRTFGVGNSPIPSINADGLTPTYEILQITYNGVTMSSATAISISTQTGQITFNYPRYTLDSLDYGTHSVLVRATTTAGSVTQSHNIIINEVPLINQLSTQRVISTTQVGIQSPAYPIRTMSATYSITNQKIDFSQFATFSLPVDRIYNGIRGLATNDNYVFTTILDDTNTNAPRLFIYRYDITNLSSMTINTATYSFWEITGFIGSRPLIGSVVQYAPAVGAYDQTSASSVLVGWGNGIIYKVELTPDRRFNTVLSNQVNVFSDLGSINFSGSLNSQYQINSILYTTNNIYALCFDGYSSILYQKTYPGSGGSLRYLTGDILPNVRPYQIQQGQFTGGGQFPGGGRYTAQSILSFGTETRIDGSLNNLYIYFRRTANNLGAEVFAPVQTGILYRFNLNTNQLELVRDIVNLGVSPANTTQFLIN